MLDTYCLWLSNREFTVRTARMGTTAVEQFADDVDAIVLDRQLPDFGGAEILDRIDDSTVPVAVVSAYEPDHHLDTDDVTLYITKPVSKSDFFDAIESVLPE